MNILAIHRSSKSGAGIAQASLYTKMCARAHTHSLSNPVFRAVFSGPWFIGEHTTGQTGSLTETQIHIHHMSAESNRYDCYKKEKLQSAFAHVCCSTYCKKSP